MIIQLGKLQRLHFLIETSMMKKVGENPQILMENSVSEPL